MNSHSCPITNQIESINDSITSLTLRIRSLEDMLDHPNLPENKRIEVETELVEIKKLIDTNKEVLASLHKENRKSFLVAACLMFVCFFVYGVYCMLSNDL
ncbi:unnamed protein product [Hermetia illucens]|uniref:Coiled-coil domain-containing protein 167 n=1 Tax=Hermetia illucens TaxID=343691 RepID=A0A7R8YQS5_HERIL|nr:uncharacterized protein LOC119647919 [Hermetia illucens]CAD7080775.1 unnamed protein product [Hermetia illucens]